MDQRPEVEVKAEPLEQALELLKASLLAKQNAQKAPKADYDYRIAAMKEAIQLLQDAMKLLEGSLRDMVSEVYWEVLNRMRSIFSESDAEAEAASGNNGHQ